MIVQHLFNKEVNGSIQSHWVLFKTKGVNYTKNVTDKVRDYLSANVNPRFSEVSDEAIKGWYTGKYDDQCLSFDEKWNLYELRDSGSFSSMDKEKVIFVEI